MQILIPEEPTVPASVPAKATTKPQMEVRPLPSSSLGCEVHGFDPCVFGHDELEKIRALIYAHKVVVLKRQRLTEEQLSELAAQLGEPVPHRHEDCRHPKYPLISVGSSMSRPSGPLSVNRTAGYWHSDTAFLDAPVPLTMFAPQIIPAGKGTTLLIDMARVYQALPEALRAQIEVRRLLHSNRWRYEVRACDIGLDVSEILAMVDKLDPPAHHPAVITHPVTKAKSLFASRGYTVGVEGLGDDQSTALLDDVLAFAEQARFITELKWGYGDVIIWDNRSLLHRAADGDLASDSSAQDGSLSYTIRIRDGHPLDAAPVATA